MAISPDFVKRLTRLRIYALALGDRTMELLNLGEVSAKRNRGKVLSMQTLSGPFRKYAHVRCAQFGLGQGATSEHPPPVGL